MPTYAITGANRGLGLEFVRQLLSDPSNTVIGAVRSTNNDLSDLKALNTDGRLHILECDTSSSSSISSFGEAVTKVLGEEGQLHYLLNNAGINAVPDQTSLDLKEADLQQHISINVFGPAKTVQVLIPHLRNGSVIVNMTSGLGSIRKGVDFKKCTTYSISKAALNMLTVQQAGDLKDRGVRVISMDPGWVRTRMGGEGAILEPEFSISSMLKTIHGLKDEETARFYTYTGEQVPW